MGEPTDVRVVGRPRRLSVADTRALVFLVVVPVVLFVGPALLGHPAIAQDNFIQNYPLRVLSGRQILSGHLPLYNPLANGGTPLLGGMNAGSLYPATLLFVFLPALGAWVANLVIVYVTAAVGLYALTRWLKFGPLPALLGAIAYGYTGAMMGQMVHLGVVEGYALLPWLVLVELALARALRAAREDGWRPRVLAAVPGTVGLAVIWGLVGLSGEPRAIAEVELVTLVVVVVELVRHWTAQAGGWRGRGAFLTANVAGALWGGALGLVQLLPGWAFITESERASVSYGFFGSGSLVVRWSALLLDQDLLGGNGALDSPRYFAGYNLPEVTGYVGILALVAVFAFAATLVRRRGGGEVGLVVFLALFVVGLLATFGSFTPLGHLFHVLPLFGETRLQSRNVVVCDLAGAVLLAWFCDRVFAGDLAAVGLTTWRRWVALLPPFAAVALVCSALLDPRGVERFFGATITQREIARDVGPLGLHLLIALGVLFALVVSLSTPARRRLLVAVFVVDLLTFSVLADTGFATGSTPTVPTRATAAAVLGTTGRYAIVDAGQGDFGLFESLGIPNLNVFSSLPSVQGYGSLVDATYDRVTGTHNLVTLNVCHLTAGDFAPLRLDTLVVSATTLTHRPGASSLTAPCQPPARATVATRYFGAPLTVSALTLHLDAVGAPAPLTVTFLGRRGTPVGAPVVTTAAATVRVAGPGVATAGFTVRTAHPVVLTSSTVRFAAGGRTRSLVVAGAYQEALDSPDWRLVATAPRYAVFRATSLPPAQWLAGDTTGSAITKADIEPWGAATIVLTAAHPVTLVRSVAWLAGWRATLVGPNGHTIAASVRRDGLIQQIAIPAGAWTVQLSYHAPHITAGIIGSLTALAALLAALVLFALSRRLGRVRK